MQGGRISNYELEELSRLLSAEKRARGCLRVLVVHHTLEQRPEYMMGTLANLHLAFPLDFESRDKLLEIAAENGVTVVLTGHRHTPLSQERFNQPRRFDKFLTGERNIVTELRAATCLSGRPEPGKQGFYAHKIELDDDSGEPVWEAIPFEFDGAKFDALSEQRITLA